MPLEGSKIDLKYKMFPSSWYDRTDVPETSKRDGGGDIRIWTKQGTFSRKNWSVTDEGDLVPCYTGASFLFDPIDLGFSDGNRTITLYVEGVKENYQNTWERVQQYKLPVNTIEFSVRVGSGEAAGIVLTDEVKYIVASQDSFYYNLVRQDVRAAHASQLIYSRASAKEYSLDLLAANEIEKLIVGDIIADCPNVEIEENVFEYQIQTKSLVEVLATAETNLGYNIGLYREYVSGKYILTFGGTDFNSATDWATNIEQAVGNPDTAQYMVAKSLGYEFSSSSFFTEDNLIFAGHSLGGGLASTASICASALGKSFNTYTFNSSGANYETVKGKDEVFAKYQNRYHVTESNIQTAVHYSAQYITAYHVDYDVVTIVQRLTPNVPSAIGLSIELDSGYDSIMVIPPINTYTIKVFPLSWVVAKCHGIETAIICLHKYRRNIAIS